MIASLKRQVRALAERCARLAQARHGPLLLGLIAFAATWSFTVAVGPFLSAFCVGAPRRWWRFALAANVSTACAAVTVIWALQAGVAPWIADQFPALMASPQWLRLHAWVDAWGLAAMLAWLALPVPQAPFVLVVGVLGIGPAQVLIAFLIGKGCKYTVTAWLAARASQAMQPGVQRYLN